MGTKTNKKKNINKRTKQIFLIDLLLFLCIICVAAIFHMTGDRIDPSTLALNGDSEMTVSIGEDFVDPGTNIEDAKVEGTVDTSTSGTYTLEYTYRGNTITRTVYVVDSDRIIMGVKGSMTQLVKQGDPYIENGAFAIDKSNGALDEDKISISGEVDTSVPGDYIVKYTAVNDDAVSSVSRTVRVLSENDFGQNDTEVSVMMYSSVYTYDDIPAKLNGNWILDSDLEEQLQYLSDRNYYYPGWKELRAWIDGEISLPENSIAMTFDVGSTSFFKYGLPLLEKYKIPSTVFLTCWEKNGAAGKVKKYASEYLDMESNSYSMRQAGGVSGYRSIVAAMSLEEIAEDLKKAQEIVKNNDAYSYPYGDVTTDAMQAVKDQGIQCAFTTDYGRIAQGMDPLRLPRVRVLGNESFEVWRQSVR